MGIELNPSPIFNQPYEGILRKKLLVKDQKSEVRMLE